jgi:hypothetical protein
MSAWLVAHVSWGNSWKKKEDDRVQNKAFFIPGVHSCLFVYRTLNSKHVMMVFGKVPRYEETGIEMMKQVIDRFFGGREEV